MPTLVIHAPDSRPFRTLLDPGHYTVGRGAGNVIAIDHPSLSETHCELEIQPDGCICVKDLGSAQGTCVADNLISDAVVKPGGIIRVGEARLWIEVLPADEETVVSAEAVPLVKERPVPATFFAAVPSAFAYALQGEFLLFIILAILVQNIPLLIPVPVLMLGLLSLVVGLLLAVFIVTIWRDIVLSTAEGHDRIPALNRSFLDWDDTKQLLWQFFVLSLVCFGPSSLGLWRGAPAWVPLLLFGLGCLYFPSALLAMLMTDTLEAANPVVVFHSIRRAPGANLFLALTLAGWLGMPYIMERERAMTPGTPETITRALTDAVVLAFVVYLSLVWMRWLGLLQRSRQLAEELEDPISP